jgi:addiction module HigA family antidote
MLKRLKPPVHPGIILREDVIKEYGLTVTDAAKLLGVTRVTLSDVLNGKASISSENGFPAGSCLWR